MLFGCVRYVGRIGRNEKENLHIGGEATKTFSRSYGRIFFMKNNKRLFKITLSLVFLFSCGPSPEEIAAEEKRKVELAVAEEKRKVELAVATCERVKEELLYVQVDELEKVMKRIGTYEYPMWDRTEEAFFYGLCKEFVLKDGYDQKLSKAREKMIAEKTRQFEEVLEIYPPKPTLKSFDMYVEGDEKIFIEYFCKTISGFDIDIVIVFKNQLGEVRKRKKSAPCWGETHDELIRDFGSDGFTNEIINLFYENNPKQYVETIYIEWNGYMDKYEFAKWHKKENDPREFRFIMDKLDVPYPLIDADKLKERYYIYP